MKERSVTYAEMPALADEVLSEVRARRSTGATVIALSGNLGAGKTTFTQCLARALGVPDDVTSPTFVIQKRYTTMDTTFATLIHIDAYRIEAPHELEVLGFAELLRDRATLVVIEWAERIGTLLPKGAYTMNFTYADDTARTVRYGYEGI